MWLLTPGDGKDIPTQCLTFALNTGHAPEVATHAGLLTMLSIQRSAPACLLLHFAAQIKTPTLGGPGK